MPAARARVAPRLALIGLSLLAGLLACAALLLLAARPVWAAPTAVTHNFPGAFPCDTTLQACIDGASDGDTIVIAANTYITSITLNKPVSLTGVLSSSVILQALAGQRVMTVTDNALFLPGVVISGLTFTGGDVSGAGAFPLNCGGGLYLGINNSPLIQNVIISGNVGASGGGVCTQNGAELRLVNSLVLSNTSTGSGGGGGVRAIGPVAITGGRFQDNGCSAGGCNGGGLLAFSTLAITGTQFISNTAQNAGGAVWGLEPIVLAGGLFQHNQCVPTAGCDGGALYAAGSVTATGTQFISNTAHTRGGGARVDGVAHLTNVLFQDNACLVNDSDFCLGAGLYTLVASVTLTDTQFLSNTALWRAGGLYADGPAVVSGGLFQGNTCTDSDCNGGGMVADGPLTLTGTQFLGNVSGGSGGGLQAVEAASVSEALFQANACLSANCQGAGVFGFAGVTLTDTLFLTNTAVGDGAGAAAVTVTVNGGLFQANTCTGAACDGGALLSSASLSVKGTQFLGNIAQQRGGAVVAATGVATLTEALFQYNQCVEAGCNGGGLYSLAVLTLNDTQFISNTSAGSGGGAYANAGTALSGGLFERNACTEAACQGGGLFVFPGNALLVTGTQVLTNTSRSNGGGINAQGPVTLTGGLFQGNACADTGCLGGGLFTNSALTANGTHFITNTARAEGGGVFANLAAQATGALFERNACTQNGCRGGGLFAGGALTLTNTAVLSNTARSDGGGAYGLSAATVSGGLFQANTCTQDNCQGGGLYAALNLNLADTDLISNTTREDGGGVWAGDDAVITGGLFERNTCTQANCQGGGLYAVNDLTLSGTTFLNNSADFSAGGVYANAGAHAALTGGLFQGNTAERGGGMNVNGSVAVTGTTFLNNAAGFDGGGLRTSGPATVTAALFRANTAVQGGGFYHGGGAGQVVNTLFANNLASDGGTQLYVNGTGGLLTVLHTTLGMQSSHNITPALTVLTGSVGVTNSIFVYHDTGIQRIFGTVYQDYNAFLQVGISGTFGVQGGVHSLMGNPVFDFTDGHFRLAPGSPAVNTGVDAGVTVDYFGQPRPLDGAFDMGYHEAAFLRVFLPLVMR